MPSNPDHASPSASPSPTADHAWIAEGRALTDLPVIGTLPPALSGQYVCTGPTRVGAGPPPEHPSSHEPRPAGEWIVHALGVGAGREPSYRSCRVTTDGGAATDLLTYGRSLLAFGAGAPTFELAADLTTIRRVDLAGARRPLVGPPRIDATTGELHLLTTPDGSAQWHVSVSPGGLTRTVRSIAGAPGTIRQLEPTRDDVVLLGDGFVGVAGRTGVDTKAVWAPIDTRARRIAAAQAHDETVIVHTVGPNLERWTVHRRDATVDREVLDPGPQSFGATHGRRPGAAPRFLWTVGGGAAHMHDLLTGAHRSRGFGAGRSSAALVFVADPDRRGTEDGGWLVGIVHDEKRDGADLVVLDAQVIDRPPVAEVRIPGRLRGGAGGTWVPAGPAAEI